MKSKNVFLGLFVSLFVASESNAMFTIIARTRKTSFKTGPVFVAQQRNNGQITRGAQDIYHDIFCIDSKECSERCPTEHGVEQCKKKGCSRGAYTQCKSIEASKRAYNIKMAYLGEIDRVPMLLGCDNRIGDLMTIESEQGKLYAFHREAMQLLQQPGEEKNWQLYKKLFMLIYHKAECLSDQANIIKWDSKNNKDQEAYEPEISNMVTLMNNRRKNEHALLKELYPQYPLLSYMVLPGATHTVHYALRCIDEEYFKPKTEKE
jgi:hypothetical protein